MATSVALLLEKVLRDEATPEEKAILLSLLDEPGNEEMVREYMDKWLQDSQPPDTLPAQKIEAVVAAIVQAAKPAAAVRRGYFARRWWVAASIALLLIASATLVIQMLYNRPAPTGEAIVQPGQNGAVLTLANGSMVSLDTIQNGVVALQGGVAAKVVNGILQYEGNATETAFNTMSTPRGRQYRLTLPDGSQVWLNAASSIRYPISFAKNERRVFITGEAYFEIAANKNQPFRVEVNGRETVEVLGTHFNINAYYNEASINTTLLRGSIRVSGINPSDAQIIHPGQQAQLNDSLQVVSQVDISKVMAWKDGLFNFEGASLPEVMRQLERWYDITVTYEKDIPDTHFGGKISMNISLAELLKELSFMGIQFRMEANRHLVVMAGTGNLTPLY